MHHHGTLNSPFSPTLGQERLLRGLAVAIALMLIALLIEAAPAAARAEIDGDMRTAAGEGPTLRLLGSREGGGDDSREGSGEAAATQALLLESHLELNVAGLLATGTLTQRFRNDSAEWREAEYLLPLPQDAAVTEMELEIGERRIVGEIREREEARQVFDAARRAGKRTALLEQQRPHLFTTRVANVPPGEEVIVHVSLVLPVLFRDGEFSLRFPTTVTAPYVPGVPLAMLGEQTDEAASNEDFDRSGQWMPLSGSGWAGPTDQVPDAPLVTSLQHRARGSDSAPLNPLSLDLRLRPGIPLAHIDALYHELAVERSANGLDVRFRDEVVEMDRDLVLRWRAQRSATPQAAVFRESFDGEEFALLMLVPPAASSPVQQLPRELVLVIDVSGSMQGEPIRQARQSVLHALDTLSPDDYVNVVAFNNRYEVLFPEARRADRATVDIARDFVRQLQADNGTEMLPALAAALSLPSPRAAESEQSPLRQLIFVTDGAVANEPALLSLIDRELGSARIFTVGIGSAPNGYFMHRAAELGRGDTVFIARPEEVAPQLNALFTRIQQPLTRDLEVQWPVSVEVFPAQVPDLYAGQPLLQVARLDGETSDSAIHVVGQLAGRDWGREIALPEAGSDAGVARHWARSKLKALLSGLQRGESRDSVRAAALPLALRFSLASPFTSFVAVEEEPVRPTRAPLLPGVAPNARPQGQAAQQFAFAQGATTGPSKLYFGAFLAFIALIGFTMNRQEPEL